MRDNEQPITPPQIHDADMHAIDQLFEHGLGSPQNEDERAAQVRLLLSMLDSPVADEHLRTSRIDLVELMARRVQPEASEPMQFEGTLSEADMNAIDAFVDSGYDTTLVGEDHRERAQKLEAMGAMLTSGDAPNRVQREDLVISTLGTIQAHIDAERNAMRIDNQRGFQLPGRWADLVSVAAMLLLAASVIMPIMSGMRSSSQQEICYNNMNQTANAFGLYTGANRDMLPMATAGFGPTWMDVGSTPERSNSSNLYTLVRNGFARLDDLACPTNPNAPTGEADPNAWDWNSLEEISYSYRIMPRGGMRASMPDQPVRVVLLADRSPVVLRAHRKESVIPEENSPNHHGNGQHMLMLDGSARWADSPLLDNRDNIWLPRPIETLIHNERTRLGIITGNEQPDGPTDAFVGP